MKHDRHLFVTIGIAAGLVIGAAIGQFVFAYASDAGRAGAASVFQFVGTTFFMNLLKMLVVPMVGSSVVVGVASLGTPATLGRVGGITLLYYFVTMLSAVCLGLLVVTTIMPGRGVDASVVAAGEERYSAKSEAERKVFQEHGEGGLWGAFRNIAGQMVPDNALRAAVEGQVLPVVTLSVLTGIVLTALGPAGAPLLALAESTFAAVMVLVGWVLLLAPLGVLFLVAATVSGIGLNALVGPMARYMATVLIALAVHGFLVLPALLWVAGRTHPYRFMHQMREALMTAFGTASSNATLPITIDAAERLGGVSKRAAAFVLPLGATINMDGTALYEAVAVVFLFQCYGIELSGSELGIIAITATLAAVGAAGIPSAGMVTMVIVVQAVNNALGTSQPNLPLSAVGILLGVDRILDMCRTAVNVWGDAVVAKIITRIAPDEEPLSP